jgi:quinol-cytochrome oxidoreductase complex cytochrome b subunit
MVIEKWIGFAIFLFLIDTLIVIYAFYLPWIKKKKGIGQKALPTGFPFDANKGQSFRWFVIWTVVTYFNIVVYTLLSWLLAKANDPNDGMVYAAAFFATFFFIYLLAIMTIIYPIVRSIVAKILTRAKVRQGRESCSNICFM